jgi:hypothetical protein
MDTRPNSAGANGMDAFGFTQECQICFAFWVPWLSLGSLSVITHYGFARNIVTMGLWREVQKSYIEDYRIWFGYFFTAGVLMMVFPTLGWTFLEHASGLVLWICFTVVGSALAFGILLWRFVPTAISLVLGIISWGVFVWMMDR